MITLTCGRSSWNSPLCVLNSAASTLPNIAALMKNLLIIILRSASKVLQILLEVLALLLHCITFFLIIHNCFISMLSACIVTGVIFWPFLKCLLFSLFPP
ncbi:hypothetical protein EGW08_002854 [Elysia chlorotica]|uniref:Uncharacterized protein n=1 Tax=Elysia chlorotica TaxID=188477 RepID=A0A433U6B0_ELYCH|nr:hypothetical protein EGW08_002854 [Elysia chlorotica]